MIRTEKIFRAQAREMRPVDKKKFDENYDAIFRKEEGEECCQKCKPKDNE